MQPCLFCRGDASDPDHLSRCDGRQGRIEHFDGETFEPPLDGVRLTAQLLRVKELLWRGDWWTLAELHAQLPADSEAGISARLRDLRKPRFGQYVVERRRRGEAKRGVFEYRLLRGQQIAS